MMTETKNQLSVTRVAPKPAGGEKAISLKHLGRGFRPTLCDEEPNPRARAWPAVPVLAHGPRRGLHHRLFRPR